MNIFGTIRTWNNVRRTRNELNSLSPRQLADIGITPGDVASAAKSMFRG